MNQDFINRVVELTNINRSQFGLSTLAFNTQLTSAAQKHSEDMALADFMAHQGSDGSSPFERMNRVGYQYSEAAENIAAGYTTPESVVEGWMNSPGHRANILDPDLREIGVGFYYLANDTGNVNYSYYWTQNFGTPFSNMPAPAPAPPPTSTSSDGSNNDDVLKGSASSDTILGLAGNDLILGFEGNDTLNGGTGIDTLEGGTGNDTYIIDNLADVVKEVANSGVDTVCSSVNFALGANLNHLTLTGTSAINGTGNTLNNTITGNTANNTLHGGAGNDSLTGGSGNDKLVGNAGADQLTGGTGADGFVFNAKAEEIDTVTDFSVVDDTIYVSKAGFGGGLTARAAIKADQFRIGSAARDPGDRFIYNTNTGGLFFDADGTGINPQVQFTALSRGLALSNNDISIIA